MPEKRLFIQEIADNHNRGNDTVVSTEIKIGQYNSDVEIWSAFKRGSLIAYQLIYDKHIDLLYDYGIKINSQYELVEDCIQELFIDLWIKRSRLGSVMDIKAYLFTSFRRRLFDLIKKNRRNLRLEGTDSFNVYLDFPDDSEMITEEVRQAVLKEINSLSQQKKEAIFLRFFNDLTCSEVAEVMGIKTQSVYNLISTGLSLIKKAFKNKND